MDFRTIVSLPNYLTDISHSDRTLLMGSCFAEHIGQMLLEAKFHCDVNPFGILYNPQSIHSALRQIMEKRVYTESDLFFNQEYYRSYMHHGKFASGDVGHTLDQINSRIAQAHLLLPRLNYLLLTFGTAWVYTLKESGQVVANCHKMPASHFERTRLSVDEIVAHYTALLQDIFVLNPDCKVVFTVSPIRHTKDGAHGNQLSKATLLLAIERLQTLFPHNALYFPSYEIVLDELRDYRFYNDDMAHPAPIAIKYIWQRFSEAFFSKTTQGIIGECEKINRDLTHRPFNKDSEAYRTFVHQLMAKIDTMAQKYPYIDFEGEKERCRMLIRCN